VGPSARGPRKYVLAKKTRFIRIIVNEHKCK
jgi:hypothetical protein